MTDRDWGVLLVSMAAFCLFVSLVAGNFAGIVVAVCCGLQGLAKLVKK